VAEPVVDDAIIVSYSELDTFRQCPLKHKWAYGQRWTQKVKPGSALDKGSLWHAVMEVHYRIVKAYQDRHGGTIPEGLDERILKRIRKEITPLLHDMDSGLQTPVQTLIEWMYDGYVEFYGIDRAWKIVAIEHQIVTPLLDEKGKPTRWHLKAKIDLIIYDRDLGTFWVVDHKSCANMPDYMAMELDDQFGLYCWILKQVKRPVQGAMHSAARTTRNQPDFPDYTGKNKPQELEGRFQRKPLSRGLGELRKLAYDAYCAATQAHPTAEARPHVKIYSSPDPRQCGWKCDFKDVHLILRKSTQREATILAGEGFYRDLRRH